MNRDRRQACSPCHARAKRHQRPLPQPNIFPRAPLTAPVAFFQATLHADPVEPFHLPGIKMMSSRHPAPSPSLRIPRKPAAHHQTSSCTAPCRVPPACLPLFARTLKIRPAHKTHAHAITRRLSSQTRTTLRGTFVLPSRTFPTKGRLRVYSLASRCWEPVPRPVARWKGRGKKEGL